MRFTVDIDTGGTFTDGFLSDGTRFEKVKVDTTPHDLTVCLLKCIEEGAKRFGFDDLGAFLKEVEIIRYSTTIGTNTILQRRGTKLGLMVTAGSETRLHGNAGPVFDLLLDRDMVIGIKEAIGVRGEIGTPLNKQEAIEGVKRLLDLGARVIIVSLTRSHLNPIHEQLVREAVADQYPKHYLGSVPIILASQFCNTPDERSRTNLALLNGYVHKDMARYLYKAEDDLRTLGYRKPLLVVHANGGVARVAKTRAVDTIGSGPAAGFIGAQYWAKKYELENVVAVDVGGTSVDIGTIVGGTFRYSRRSEIFGVPVDTPLVGVTSRVGGGGTIARIDRTSGGLVLGPESAGARPGPACYDLGGSRPTVTDANLVLNRIDGANYLGGRKLLSVDKARAAIDKGVATPSGSAIEDAALQIVDELHRMAAEDVLRLIEATGIPPSEFVMFAYGGGGPTHCCGVAEKSGIPRIYTFPFSPVFSAFGSSTMDVLHVYERAAELDLLSDGAIALNRERFNSVVTEMQHVALRDLEGEGFSKANVVFSLELEISTTEDVLPIQYDKVLVGGRKDIKLIADSYLTESRKRGIPPSNNVCIQLLRLRALCPLPKYEFAGQRSPKSNSLTRSKGTRRVYWANGWVETSIYDLDALDSAYAILGEAVLESSDTTHVIPNGWTCHLDQYQNTIISRVPQ